MSRKQRGQSGSRMAPLGCAALTFLSMASIQGAVHAESSATALLGPHSGARRVLERVEGGERERALLREALSGREAALDFLPLAELRSVRVQPTWIELRFDFGRKGRKKVAIPSLERLVYDAARKRLIRIRTKARKLSIHDRVRIEFDESGFRGVREGDIQVYWGLARFDVELHTEHCPGRVERDNKGRILVLTDAAGNAVYREGLMVYRTADEWLVLESTGRTIEVPLG